MMMEAKPKKFAVLKSPANRVILSTLGWRWTETENAELAGFLFFSFLD
jgi:hypothetical protein